MATARSSFVLQKGPSETIVWSREVKTMKNITDIEKRVYKRRLEVFPKILTFQDS